MNYETLRRIGRGIGATIAYPSALTSLIFLGAGSPEVVIPLSVTGIGTLLYIASEEPRQNQIPLENRIKKD